MQIRKCQEKDSDSVLQQTGRRPAGKRLSADAGSVRRSGRQDPRRRSETEGSALFRICPDQARRQGHH